MCGHFDVGYCCRVRQWSYSQLTQLLGKIGEGGSLPSDASVPYHDVLVSGRSCQATTQTARDGAFQVQQNLRCCTFEITRICFQQEDVLKLMQIINSETVDVSYKKSALEQLAILLQGTQY